MNEPRIVCQFSCGAASAVATKLILSQYPRDRVVILNAFIKEEHPDNRRFLSDCEKWFGHPVTVLRDEKFGASVDEVWRQEKYMKGPYVAICSKRLKRELLDAFTLPGDRLVFGFTAEELDWAERFPAALTPLIDANLTHADCLAMVERAGIELPMMYRLGFNNANCVGCCKGGEGYWNKIRKVFPERFAEVVQIEKSLGYNSFLFRNRTTGVRFGVKDLPLDAGRHDEPLPTCSFYCAMAETEFARTEA